MRSDPFAHLATGGSRPRFGWGWIVIVALVTLWMEAPTIQATGWPVRTNQSISGLYRDPPGWIRFTWNTNKRRFSWSDNVDVFLTTPDNLYNVAIYNDRTPIGGAPCSVVVPWARSGAVGLGEQHQRFCVEIPRPVKDADPIAIKIVAHYQGLWGMWDMPLVLPPISVPGI